MNSTLKIAHISDPHLSSLDHINWDDLLNKRILGYLSWKLKRRDSHSREVLSRTLADLARHQADHLIISGDFTHLGTANECRETETWLDSIGRPDNISIVPGNHDQYVATDFTETTGRWLAYMQSDPGEQRHSHVFPYLRVRGPVALIGLSTALPTAPFFASGKLGGEQLQRLRHLLETTAQRGLYRIVVLHHSPHILKLQTRLGRCARTAVNPDGYGRGVACPWSWDTARCRQCWKPALTRYRCSAYRPRRPPIKTRTNLPATTSTR